MAKLLDQYGNPVELRRLVKEEAGPTVTGVRQIVSGHPSWGLTPDRLARLLRDAEDGDPTAFLELAEEMEEKDLHYAAVLGTRKRQVAQLDITVESASDSAEDVANADLVRELLTRDELQDDLVDILDALGKGFSVTEIIWKTGDRWWPERFEWRDPTWFRFDPADGRTVRLLGESGQLEPLAPYKYIVHKPRIKSGLPIRGGLARPVAWAYLFKNFGIKDWIVFAEIFGIPLRLGKFDAGASDADKAILLRAVREISNDAAAIIPRSMEIEFPEAGGKTGSVDLFERLAEFFDRQISKGVLGQTATTDAIKGGYAVGKTHDNVREDIEQADARQLGATINRDVVRPLIDLNKGPQKAYPRVLIGRAEQTDIPEMSEALAKLVPLGLTVEQSVVRDRLGFPDPAPDAEVLGQPVAAPNETDPAKDTKPTASQALATALAAAQADAERDDLDDLADHLDDAAAPAMDELIEACRAVFAGASDLQDAAALLFEIFPNLDVTRLAKAIGAGFALGELTGRAEVSDG